MEFSGINWYLLAAQLVNIVLLALWILLIGAALWQLGRRNLPLRTTLLAGATALCLPLIGALTVLALLHHIPVRPGTEQRVAQR